ncbi:MAG: hypothetical protein RL329_2825 [Bacteroidota bacterium]|jgi:hypothetical protein
MHNNLIEDTLFPLDPPIIPIDKSDTAINEKYRKGEMRIVTEIGRIDLHSISSMIDSKQGGKQKYILNPEYQRRKRWNNKRKSLLIESFIMNVPIPPIFLYEIEYAVYEVMDGLQRLTAIDEFYKGKFVLEGLEYWRELEGKRYQDLPNNVRAGIDRRYLSSVILLAETATDEEKADFLKKVVFGRLNSGGEKLTPQELRNALYAGKFNDLCIELAKNETFRKMWRLPLEREVEDLLLKTDKELEEMGEYTPVMMESYRRMDDVELVLRFFAYGRGKDKNLTRHTLDEQLKKGNAENQTVLNQSKTLFTETIQLIYDIFGSNAFVMPKRSVNSKTPTKTIYDPLMQAFAKNLPHKAKLLEHKKEIVNHIYNHRELVAKTGKNLFDEKTDKPLFDSKGQYVLHIEARIQFFDDFLKSFIA